MLGSIVVSCNGNPIVLIGFVQQDTLSCQSSWNNNLAVIVTGVTRPSESEIEEALQRISHFVIGMMVVSSGLEDKDNSSSSTFQHKPKTLTVSFISAVLCCCARSLRDRLLDAQEHRLNFDRFIKEQDARKY